MLDSVHVGAITRVSSWRIFAALASVATMLVLGPFVSESRGFGVTQGTIPIYALYPAAPAVSSSEAIAYLNEQRTANGIPGDLVQDQAKDQGCLDWARLYDPAPNQYPHEELSSQPGYTPGGDEAASHSALDGGGPHLRGQRFEHWWSADQNPWSTSPFHLFSLLSPTATTAWYGESGNNACMGTTGARQFSAPSFFSFPGSGAVNVPVSERAAEEPFTPAEALGIRETTGPNFILYSEGVEANLQSATLTGPSGAVPLRIVRPATIAPRPNSPGFPTHSTVGEYVGRVNVLVPPRLAPSSKYTFSIVWTTTDGASYSQQINFTTSHESVGWEGLLHQESFPSPGTIKFAWHWPTLRISGDALLLGHRVAVRVWACTDLMHCPAAHQRYLVNKITVLHSSGLAISLHGKRAPGQLVMTLTLRPFKAGAITVQGTVRGQGFLLR